MFESSNRTTLGVMASPSLLLRVVARPSSVRYAIAENVVPRSIPIGGCFAIALNDSCDSD
jgi:hypothetical protein